MLLAIVATVFILLFGFVFFFIVNLMDAFINEIEQDKEKHRDVEQW